MKILFVCTGNTCRSPMAEALLKSMTDFNVISGGLYAPEGEGASENAILAMKEIGIDISDHRAKNVNAEVLAEADLIITMSASHKNALIPYAEGKVFTLYEMAGEKGDISDPYGKSLEVYRKTRDEIKNLLQRIKYD